ncbi:MAG: hypothetical protein ABI620_06085 [Chloroflexota bacterium]
MSGRRGAGGGEPPVADQAPAPPRAFHPRPILVELASAVLIVGAAMNLLISIDGLLNHAQAGDDIGVPAAITIAVATMTLALGLATRVGRMWLVTVNVMAVIGFLELLSQTSIGLLFGALDVFVVLALVRERPWFEWSARQRAEAA